jgi:hypothetical protein
MKRGILIISVILILMGCGKGGSNSNPTPGGSTTNGGGTTSIPAPAQASLTLPAQNTVCTTGTVTSSTESTIQFTWNASANTDSYDLYLKNLLTSITTTQNTTSTQLNVTLLRNTPYSWYIVSKSTKTATTAQSDTWKFYNAGPGTITYSPFPAEIISPTFAQNVTATAGTVNLTWKGSSVNPGTITAYDVYFGTTTSPAILKSGVTDSFLNNVSVTSNTTYYWKVITKDILGNTSDSGIYQFSVN